MIEKEAVRKLAGLARIKLSDSEIEKVGGDIDSILAFVSQVERVSVKADDLSVPTLRNVMREDGDPHIGGLYSKELLREVPEREGDYVKVKKIL